MTTYIINEILTEKIHIKFNELNTKLYKYKDIYSLLKENIEKML